MLKNKTKFIAIFLIIILLFSTTFVFADNESNDDEVTAITTDVTTDEIENSIENIATNAGLQEDNYKKNDVYLNSDNITIDYIVDGNLFVCANTVTINSQIGGDAFILAKNVIIGEKGYVFNNLFAISNSVEIKGVVYDVYALAKNLTIAKGYVYRDLKTSCNTLNINGVIGRNAFINCSNINFNTDENTNGIIYGNLNYKAKSEFSIPENVINGTVNYTPAEISSEKSVQAIIANYILNLGCFLAFILIVWLVCVLLAPKFLENTNNYVGKKTLSILGTGLLTIIVVPIACIILILLQLTSGVSLFLLALYILALIVSTALFTITANNYICSKLKINKNLGIFGMLIISGIIIWILTQIPYIGGLISLIVTVLGLGILITSILPKKLKKDKIVTKNENAKKIDKEK